MDTVNSIGERDLFCRMLDVKMDPNFSKRLISYWMYLESNGFNGLLKRLLTYDDNILSLICFEAEATLSSLVCGPITSNLANPAIVSDMFKDRDKVRGGVSEIYNGVCSVVFEDILEERGLKVSENLHSNNIEGTSEQGAALGGSVTKVTRSELKLNPFAREWDPMVHRANMLYRSLFMTFSRGFPLTETEIHDYFTYKYGDCVENVDIHQPRDREPMFGKILFKASFIPAMILAKMETARFWINGRPVWLKKYRPRNPDA